MLKNRNPILGYLGILVFQALYATYWCFTIGKDIRRLSPNEESAMRWFPFVIFIVLAVFLLVLAVIEMHFIRDTAMRYSIITFGKWLAITWLLVVLIFLIIANRRVLVLMHKQPQPIHDIAMVLLTVPFLISFPVIQSRINKVISNQKFVPS
jgi:hypothetical protein